MLSKGVWLGMKMGGKTGFLLSLLYSLPLVLLFLFAGPLGALYALFIATIVGIAPAITLGLLIGAIVGATLQSLIERLTPLKAVLVGMFVSLGLVVVVTIIILAQDSQFSSQPFDMGYWFYLGVPSAICILVGGLMAYWLARRLKPSGTIEKIDLLEYFGSSLDIAMMIVGVIFLVGGIGYSFYSSGWGSGIVTFYSLFVAVLGVLLLWLFKFGEMEE